MADSVLALRASTAVLSDDKDHISIHNGIVKGWGNTTTEISWEVKFVNIGEVKISIELANVKSLAGAEIEAQINGQTVCGVTKFSGGWKKFALMKLGKLVLSAPGQFAFKIRAKRLNGVYAGDLQAVILKGPAVKDATEDIIPARADSIHLNYQDGGGCVLFYNQLKVVQTYPGTFFVACGFHRGYFGIQDNDFKGTKTMYFSIWDPNCKDENDPDKIPEEERSLCVKQGCDVEVKRFGNEGTGCKNIFKYNWKVNEIYHFLVKVQPGNVPGTVCYSGYFYINETSQWKHISTCQVISGPEYLSGLYCFVEDYIGSYGKFEREAHFGPGWRQMPDGQWVELSKCYFSQAGSLPNTDAGIADDGLFYLKTGGRIKQSRPVYSKIYAKSTALPEFLKNVEADISNAI